MGSESTKVQIHRAVGTWDMRPTSAMVCVGTTCGKSHRSKSVYPSPSLFVPELLIGALTRAPADYGALARSKSGERALARAVGPGNSTTRPPATTAVKHPLRAAGDFSLATVHAQLYTMQRNRQASPHPEESCHVDACTNVCRVTWSAAAATARATSSNDEERLPCRNWEFDLVRTGDGAVI
jgi:hypothetical protein